MNATPVLKAATHLKAALTPVLALVALATLSVPVRAQTPAPGCEDLNWSAQVLAANPDIGQACRGVYQRNGELFAKVTVELTAVRGNRLTFRPLHSDGSKGSARSINVRNGWRADIDGRPYRASDLQPGQMLNVYIPEDRFALALDDGTFDGDEELMDIEGDDVVRMPPPR